MQNSKNSKKNTLIIASLFADVILCQDSILLIESNFASAISRSLCDNNVIRFGQPVKVNIRLM